jgi:hypothetical protein
MRGAVSTQKRKEIGVGASALLGVFLGLAMLVGSIWFSESQLKAGLLTASLFWALTTSFSSRWRDSTFWIVVGFLFALHLVAISAVMRRMGAMNLYSILVIGFVELALMFVVVLLTATIRNDS